ncbi:hypothetical protein NECAME_17781 [Necator americanus]|uniref:Uncharacterized protein n=1 Tax=Necator americanus TaxID=51031 RepID=W2TM94_NECAM|nr:hypothetical protein NECAME_17781 [Necator americanus]ETN82157.1 hypothetical protein NECAME_17781 [Necator americanus]
MVRSLVHVHIAQVSIHEDAITASHGTIFHLWFDELQLVFEKQAIHPKYRLGLMVQYVDEAPLYFVLILSLRLFFKNLK